MARVRLAAQAALGPMEIIKVDGLPQLVASDLGTTGLSGQDLLDALAVEVTFTDMAGIRWKRRDNERPERVVD